MSQGTEPSLSEYARFYGLSIGHLDYNPLLGLSKESVLHSHLEDPDGGFKIDESLDISLAERLQVGVDEAILLASVTASPPKAFVFDQDSEIDTHRVRNLKAEIPLLATDHEIDMQQFASPVVPDLVHEHLPLESVEDEADEGLAWPSRFYRLPEEYMIKAEKEQLEISEEVLRSMHETLHSKSKGEDHPSFEIENPTYKRHISIEPLTPPLLPLSPMYLPYEPSSDAGLLEVLTNPSSPTLQELNNIDGQVFEEDAITKRNDDLVANTNAANAMLPEYENIGDIYTPLKGIEEPPSSPLIRKPPHWDAKVEVPMTPPHSDIPLPWNRKNVSFKDAVHEIIPEIPPPIPKPEDPSSEDIDGFIATIIAPAAAQTERSIEQEQLQEADTTHRVAVPVMDFSLPVAPWKASAGSASLAQSKKVKPSLLELMHSEFSKHPWLKAGSTDFSLQWMPFPAALGRVETYESITDDRLLDEFLAQPEGVDSSTLTWKPEGLRILDNLEDSEDEELQEGIFPNETDMESLLHKRRLELEQLHRLDTQDGFESDSYEPLGEPVDHEAFRKVPRLSPQLSYSKAEATRTQEPQASRTEEELSVFSARNSLDNFMSIRNHGAKNFELTAQQYLLGKKDKFETSTEIVQEEHKMPAKSSEATSPSTIPLVAAPDFSAPQESTPFVISTSFLLNRKLAQQVQRLYPSAEFIERDFSLHLAQSGKGVGKRDGFTPKASTMMDEADIIVSPSTGLVLTTLQKIKQRSLPGQTSKSAIRERIERTFVRYERLVILVSSNSMEESQVDAPSSGARILDEKDCDAIVEFNAFCLAIKEDIHVIFTAGDVENLAKWVVALMIKHGYTNSQMKLLQEETLWEVFLRRAGLNAFAAQAILAELKKPNTDNIEQSSEGSAMYFGLAAFIRMSLQERIHRFERLLGGRDLLENVSRILDAQWSPDGTTILTSSADNILKSFILPTDLLATTEPHDLQPYDTHILPESAYATAFYPNYSLHNPSTTLFLASLRQLPIRLYSPFAPAKVASYSLITPTTEAFIAPHSLEFSVGNPNQFYAGSESCISTFDIQRDGEGPFERIYTTPSRRGMASGRVGMKGIVSALASNTDGILAAGTFTRWVGLCDARVGGGISAVFPLDENDKRKEQAGVGQGTGITQLLWSTCLRYLCVIERNTDGIGVWDIRGSGERLAWLNRRKALTPQRLGAEIVDSEVWAGGMDGNIRVWEGLGASEGVVEPCLEFHAHDDAVCASTFHYSGTVLATASGQQHLGTSSSFREQSDGEPSGKESSSDKSTLSGTDSSSAETPSKNRTLLTENALLHMPGSSDSSLKLWSL